MPAPLRSRISWGVCAIGIIALGILSRVWHTGFILFDKYLGDALYAAMIYGLLRIFWLKAHVALPAMLLVTAIELFQLTKIPAQLLANEHFALQAVGRLLGTQFSLLDLFAYGVGVGCIYLVDSRIRSKRSPEPEEVATICP